LTGLQDRQPRMVSDSSCCSIEPERSLMSKDIVLASVAMRGSYGSYESMSKLSSRCDKLFNTDCSVSVRVIAAVVPPTGICGAHMTRGQMTIAKRWSQQMTDVQEMCSSCVLVVLMRGNRGTEESQQDVCATEKRAPGQSCPW